MTTDTDVAAPSPIAAAEAARSGRRPATVRRRRGLPVGGLLAAGLIAGLFGFNAWWYWRDTRPLANLSTIEGWIAREKYPEAEAALREHLRREPYDGEARMVLGRVLAARGDLPGCARELHQVPFWWPKKAEALYREGQVYLMIDRARDAEAAWQQVIKDDPLHPVDPAIFHDAGQGLLTLYSTEDRWDDVYTILWRAYDQALLVDRPVLLAMRIRSELERVAPGESSKILRRYVAADPTDWEARRALAKAELALDQRAEALSDMQACLKALPEDPRVWSEYLDMLQKLGELDAFNAALAQVPETAETEPQIWMFRGQVRERAGDWEGAAEDYRQALERNPNLLNAHYRLSMSEERLGHRDQAAIHRKRWNALREARAGLSQAFGDYQAAQAGQQGGPDLLTSVKRLASICETMGWVRAAQGWNRIAASL